MKLLEDILYLINSFSMVDIIFFFAIIALLILLVTLVYFIKINKDVLDSDDLFKHLEDDLKEDEKKEEVVEKVKPEEPEKKEEEEFNDEEGELLDLKALTEKLQKENIESSSNFEYEKEQEEKAIISYDELLQKKNKYAVNYEKEEVMDDLVVKKVDLNDLVNKNELDEVKEVRVISYEKEEAFLNALKELNKLLN